MFIKLCNLFEVTGILIILIQIQTNLVTATSEDLLVSEIEINLCNEKPPAQNGTSECVGDSGKGMKPKRYYYENDKKECLEFNVSDCGGGNSDTSSGFSSLDECQSECVKSRPVRRLPVDNQYRILSDFEITAPKKLSPTTKRKFPLQFCNLQWDSGLICPGLKRGSYMDQFYYDGKTNSCAHFVYNGCGGNANRFFTIWECIQSCVRKYHHDGFKY